MILKDIFFELNQEEEALHASNTAKLFFNYR